MWAIFSFIYNSILIIFIAVHLLVGALIAFCVGVYIGIYLCQNYDLPLIDEPYKLWLCFVDFLEKRKKPGSMSVFDIKRRISFRRSRSNINDIRSSYAGRLSGSTAVLNGDVTVVTTDAKSEIPS